MQKQKKLTTKQALVYDYFVRYHCKNNRPPTYRKAAEEMGMSLGNLYQHVKLIEKKGFMNGNISTEIKTTWEK